MYGERQTHEGGWTDERVDALKALWHDGLSASQIAAELGGGTTRNAVISKVHRLKLPARQSPVSNAPTRKPRANGKGQPKANAIVHNLMARSRAPTLPESCDMEDGEGVDCTHLVDIMDLNDSRCRWPMGPETGSAQKFCGVHKSRHAGPYCPEHTRRSEPQR